MKPLISWRAWKLSPNHELSHWFSLCSLRLTRCNTWPFGTPMKRSHEKHGIYSRKTLASLVENELSENSRICFGTIYNWGKIEEYQLGYQSEFAYPKKVYFFDNEMAAKEIKNNYGCETTNLNCPKDAWIERMKILGAIAL